MKFEDLPSWAQMAIRNWKGSVTSINSGGSLSITKDGTAFYNGQRVTAGEESVEAPSEIKIDQLPEWAQSIVWGATSDTRLQRTEEAHSLQISSAGVFFDGMRVTR